MSEQRHLSELWGQKPYGGAAPAVEQSETSVAAAKQIAPDAATLRRRIFELLRRKGRAGATDEEMQLELQIQGNTQRPRRREMQLSRMLADSGRTRPTNSGRQATVWVLRQYAGT